MDHNQQRNISERFMAGFALQKSNNDVYDVDLLGFVQRLLLFDHCIIPTIWLKDLEMLMRSVKPSDLAALIQSGAMSFYIDSATAAEMGQARAGLNLSGNITRLQDNEFHFVTLRGKDDYSKVRESISQLACAEGVHVSDARAVADLVDENLLEPRGLEITADAFHGFYADLRSVDVSLVERLIGGRLRSLGIKPKGLEVRIEEFVPEDFRVHSNLSKFGLFSKKAREVTLGAFMDLIAVHSRLAHMRDLGCLIGMNPKDQQPWEIKVESLVRMFEKEHERERQFTRVITLAGIGESNLIEGKKIDLRKLIRLRESEDLTLFRAWLKDTDNKSDEEIRDRLNSLRGRIGNKVQGVSGKVIRMMVSGLSALVPNPIISLGTGLALSAADSFFVDKLLPKDTIQNIVSQQYPDILGRNRH